MHSIRETTPNNCLSCAKGQLKFWFVKKTAYGSFPVCVCNTCRSGFIWPRPSQQMIDDFYQHLHDTGTPLDKLYSNVLEAERLHPNASIDAARIISLLIQKAPGKRFLDVGAGMGHFSKVAYHAGFQVTAIEPADLARDVFHRITGGLTAQAGMLNDTFANAHPETFDAVLLSQSLEHMLNPQAAVKHLHRLLTPNGVVCIAVPLRLSWVSIIQGRNDMYIIPPEHLNFFTHAGLVSLFERSGFDLLFSHTVSRFDPRRVMTKLPLLMRSRLTLLPLSFALRISDWVGKGFILNAYFRKLPM